MDVLLNLQFSQRHRYTIGSVFSPVYTAFLENLPSRQKQVTAFSSVWPKFYFYCVAEWCTSWHRLTLIIIFSGIKHPRAATPSLVFYPSHHLEQGFSTLELLIFLDKKPFVLCIVESSAVTLAPTLVLSAPSACLTTKNVFRGKNCLSWESLI